MTDFSVVLGDLDALSGRFSSAARDYDAAAAKLNPPTVDSGDGGCNSAMNALMEMLGVLNRSMSASIEDHSAKLHDARDEYDRTEEVNKNRFLWDNLNKDFQ
ncbi:DUF6317 family protein [Williamsia maris]|uniref:Excreted virulence factor EspC (Type VII ESX diderm) n=1 Tax=Williamsia maris TaxID=72806 RepID=A0ABT1HCS5_9NOCA|nr:DUF6317 family protein [Williamsia maris]MCP2174780.1 hypothetical protein [Williamsia maris]